MTGFFIPLRIALALRYDFVLPFIAIFLLLWAAWRLPTPWGEGVSAFFTTLLFSGSLAALWRMGYHEIYQVFGLLPWFDGQGYYSEALRLLDGGLFTQISARRPLFPGFFASMLLLTDRNLRFSLLLISFISGISTWLFAREFKHSEIKAMIPAGITTFLFLYYRSFNGAVLSETLGYPLGCLGLAFLWNAANNRRLFPALAGLFCITLALSARPGAVFSLPLLLLWLIFSLDTGTRRLKKAFWASTMITVGLLFNSTLTNVLAPGISASYSNFAQTFYGLVNGGVGWLAVYSDHPEFFVSGNEGMASRQIYKAAFDILMAHPEKTIQGVVRALQGFFSAGASSAFNFLGGESSPLLPDTQNAPVEFFSRWTANILLLLLFPITLITRLKPKFTLLLALNFGIIISLPFAPTGDAENLRAYAASVCGMVAAVVCVIQYLLDKTKANSTIPTPEPRPVYAVSTILILAMILAPLGIRFTAKPPVLPSTTCPIGEEPLVTRVSTGSFVSVGNNPADPFTAPYARFEVNLDQFPDAIIGKELKNIPENMIISQQNNLIDEGNAVWLVAPINILPVANRITMFCGNWSRKPETKFIFYATQVAR